MKKVKKNDIILEIQEKSYEDLSAIAKSMVDSCNGDKLKTIVWLDKYAHVEEDGMLAELTPNATFKRVAIAIASVEKTEQEQKYWADEFYKLMSTNKLIPGGRIIAGAGIDAKRTLQNCYFIDLEDDSLEGIFNLAKEIAVTYSRGGGCGIDLSKLRPYNSPVHNAARESTGAASFMDFYSYVTGMIGQFGRRGALLISMDVSHPDIRKFINMKRPSEHLVSLIKSLNEQRKTVRKNSEIAKSFDKAITELAEKATSKVRFANISVKISDAFMQAVEKGENWDLVWGGKTFETVKAADLFNEIIQANYESAEPGALYWDTAVRYSNSEKLGYPIRGVNPCSEQNLCGNTDSGEKLSDVCGLGNINLAEFASWNGEVSWEQLAKAVKSTTRFLDNMVDYNFDRHPLRSQRNAVRLLRRIGIGFTGYADMLIKKGLIYGSKEALQFTDELFKFTKFAAYSASIDLAKERGEFLALKGKRKEFLTGQFLKEMRQEADALYLDGKDKLHICEAILKYGIRNVALLNVPPVGTGAIMVRSSSGCEPIFRRQFSRRTESISGNKTYIVLHPLIEEYMKLKEISDIKNIPTNLFIESSDIAVEDRVLTQAAIQKHIDASISSTINLVSTATTQDIYSIYFRAWKSGCKGITVYRDGSRQGILQEIKEDESEVEDLNLIDRPFALSGETLKLKYRSNRSLYLTANKSGGKISEIFLVTNNSEDVSWALIFGRLLTALFRHVQNPEFIIDEFKQIKQADGVFQIDVDTGKGFFVPGFPYAVGYLLEKAIKGRRRGRKPGVLEEDKNEIFIECPKCNLIAYKNDGGCFICTSCGFSKCS